MRKENGGPAFPVSKDISLIHEGMTLRDYFAAKAMQGLMGRVWDANENNGEQIIRQWATSAYATADAMLA